MLDIFIIVLLLIAIIYSWKLNRKLHLLKESKMELAEMVKGFEDSISNAESAISELKHLGSDSFNEIKQKINTASYLANDLSFMTERAVEIADRLDKLIENARDSNKKLHRSNTRFYIRDEAAITSSNMHKVNLEYIKNFNDSTEYKESEKSSSNIDFVLDRISKTRLTPKENIEDYKPKIVRQNEYYNSLRKI